MYNIINSNFLVIYDLNTITFIKNDNRIISFNHKTCSGDIISFKKTISGLELSIPFFLLDNVFYYQLGSVIYFSQNIQDFNNLTSPDIEANKHMNIHGFLPHSRTQYDGVKIICSYLKYIFSKNGIVIQNCYPQIEMNFTPTVDDLMECLKIAFRKQIEKVNSESFILF